MTKQNYLKENAGKTYGDLLVPYYESHSKLRGKMMSRITKAVEYYKINGTLLCLCSNGDEVSAENLLLEFNKPGDAGFEILSRFKLELYPEFQAMAKVKGASAARHELRGILKYIDRMNQLIENAREAHVWSMNFIDKTIHYLESSQPVMNRGNICRAFTPVSNLSPTLSIGQQITLINPRKGLEEEFEVIMIYPYDDGYQVQDVNGNIKHLMDEIDYSDIYYDMTPENRLAYGMAWHMKRYTYKEHELI